MKILIIADLHLGDGSRADDFGAWFFWMYDVRFSIIVSR